MILSSRRSASNSNSTVPHTSSDRGGGTTQRNSLERPACPSPSTTVVVTEKCSTAAATAEATKNRSDTALKLLVPSSPTLLSEKRAMMMTPLSGNRDPDVVSSSSNDDQSPAPESVPEPSSSPLSSASYFEQNWSNIGWNTSNFFHSTREELVKSCSSLLYELFQNAFQSLPRDTTMEENNTYQTSLYRYVDRISRLYKPNIEFHNWHHAAHVLISTHHLMQHYQNKSNHHHHRRPSGTSITTITENPTTCPFLHFVMVLSALIHDVDHLGVTNLQLEKENHDIMIATTVPKDNSNHKNNNHTNNMSNNNSYHIIMEDTKSSYLEAHSIALGIHIMEKEFADLYETITQHYPNFCTIVKQVVLATDISSADRREQCSLHWQTAFGTLQQQQQQQQKLQDGPNDNDGDETTTTVSSQHHYDATVTIDNVSSIIKTRAILEHIIQAADVSHCCQKFDTFLQWNEALYRERLVAFLYHRGDDPRHDWYESNVGFFQFYIVPLATKCDLVVDMSGTILNQAKLNLQEWQERGKDLTQQMQHKFTPQILCPELFLDE